MPLTPSKLKHLTGKLNALLQGRSQPVTLTLKNPDGTTSTLSLTGIFRAEVDLDPSFDHPGHALADPHMADAILLLRMADVTYAQLRSVVTVSPGSPAGGQLMATTYLPTSISPKGLPPGGDRWLLTLTRQRP